MQYMSFSFHPFTHTHTHTHTHNTFCYSIIEPHYLLIFYFLFSFLNFTSHYSLQKKQKQKPLLLPISTHVRLHFLQPFPSLFTYLLPPTTHYFTVTLPLSFSLINFFIYNLTLLLPILFVYIYGYTSSNLSLPSLLLYLPHYSLLHHYNSFILFPFL